MNINKIIILLLSFTLITPSVMAANVEITWTEPEQYRDIHPGEGSRKHFREQTFKNFEKHFSKLASQLPEEQILKIEVTDIDLAGSTHHGGINRIRVVKEIYSPRMEFSYQLVNADGANVLEGDANLKDMNFMMSRTLKYRNDSLGYEKVMIDKWFNESFKELLIKQ